MTAGARSMGNQSGWIEDAGRIALALALLALLAAFVR
jgi:hypothetical protein